MICGYNRNALDVARLAKKSCEIEIKMNWSYGIRQFSELSRDMQAQNLPRQIEICI